MGNGVGREWSLGVGIVCVWGRGGREGWGRGFCACLRVPRSDSSCSARHVMSDERAVSINSLPGDRRRGSDDLPCHQGPVSPPVRGRHRHLTRGQGHGGNHCHDNNGHFCGARPLPPHAPPPPRPHHPRIFHNSLLPP